MEDGRIVSYDEAQEKGAIKDHDGHEAHRRSEGSAQDHAAESRHLDQETEQAARASTRQERLRMMQNANSNFEDAVGEFDMEQTHDDVENAQFEDTQFEDCQGRDMEEEEEEGREVPASRRQRTGGEDYKEDTINGARGDFNLNKENQGPSSFVGHRGGDWKQDDEGDEGERGRSCTCSGNSECRCRNAALAADRESDNADEDADQPDQSEEGSADANPDGDRCGDCFVRLELTAGI